MANDLESRDSAAAQRIKLGEDWSVDYWKTTLGVAREELIAAVRAVGDDVQQVSEYLAKKSAAGPSS